MEFVWSGVLGFVGGVGITVAAHLTCKPWGFVGGVIAGGLACLPFVWFKNRKRQTASISALLGSAVTSGIFITQLYPTYKAFGAFLASLSIFHFSEYLVTALYNSSTLNFDSFLLNHSYAYGIAMTAALVEYGVRARFFPQYLTFDAPFIVGLVLVITGDLFRKIAMITAANNFKHLVQTKKRDDHALVTHGIYSVVRHPAYAGWFWWSVGSQILLGNVFCTIGFAAASFVFFKDRLDEEEYFLIRFFGRDYVDYKEKVWSGVPFIS
eukprot:m.136464 g.136464  ORF g.136464 m.136464 type:complete len:267 (+) comp10682_c0_seq1:66-866(+)